jgi:hypothetical protein
LRFPERAGLQIEKKIFKFPRAGRMAWPADLPDRLSGDFDVESCLQKYFASPVGQIISTNSRHPTPPEGRIAIVTDAGCGCGGRGSVRRAT